MSRTGAVGVFQILLALRWKQFARSPQFGQRLAIRILTGFMGVYLLLNLLFVGYFLPRILAKTHPDANIPELVNGYILHLFLGLLVMRYFLQKMPSTQLQAFLTLPVRKSRLVLAYLGLLGLHGFNYVAIILALPLWVQTILPVYPLLHSLLWLAGILLLSLASAALVLLVKMFAFDRPLIFFAFLLTIVGLFLLDQLPLLAVLPGLSGGLFNGLLAGNWQTLLAGALGTGMLAIGLFRIMRGKLHLAEGKSKSSGRAIDTQEIKTARFGRIWILLWLEWRLIWRNRVTRLVIGIALFFIPWGLWTLYQLGDRASINPLGLAFASIMASGSVFVLTYAGSLFSWEGNYFDALLARTFFTREFVYNKILFFTLANIWLLLFCAMTFGWLRSDIVLFVLSVFLYNSAFVTFIFIFAAFYHRKAFPINGSVFATGGWQGKTFWNIFKIILINLPFIVLMVARGESIINRETVIMAAGWLALIGFISLCFLPWWRKILVNKFRQQKYIMAEGFRQK